LINNSKEHTGSSSATNNQSNLELTFLGTGSAFSIDGRYWGSILVNDNILLDCSPIVVPHLKKLAKKLSDLEFIFITHFHGDHILGLPFLLLDFAYLTKLEKTLTIIGPRGLEDKVTKITDHVFPGVMEKLQSTHSLVMEYLEILAPGSYSASQVVFETAVMSHGSSNAYGYKLTVGDKKIVYTGDTDICPGISSLASDADILIIELSNPDKDVPGHMSLNKLEKLRQDLPKGIKIILNHVGEIPEKVLDDKNLILPNDLDLLRF
jgi:ribonuclease BN (tRNA processing enzyme)